MSQFITGFYQYRTKEDGFDKIMLITKEKNGEKRINLVEKPNIIYYVSDPNKVDVTKDVRCLPKSCVKKVQYYYKDLYKSITQELNDQNLYDFFDNCLANNNFGALKQLFLDYRVHGADVNIIDHYIHRFMEKNPFEENNLPLTKLFFDIETDGTDVPGFTHPEEALARVNIITGVYEEDDVIHIKTFSLKYDNETYHDAFKKDSIQQLGVDLRKKYAKRTKKEIKISIYQFDSEIKLIYAWFNFVNILKPDFVLAWNSHGFDNPYLMNRISVLGYEPKDIMCPKEMPYKKVEYRKDSMHQLPSDNNTLFKVNSYSNYIDLMNLYANLRKANGQKESYSLDYIGEIELGEHKDDLETSIKTAHLDNYTRFMKYNIQDVMLLYFLEEKDKDIETLFGIANITQTRVESALKKTICLRNLANEIYEKNGYVLSDNRAKLRNAGAKKIPGAFVADLGLVDKVGKLMNNGERSNKIFEEVIDQDLSSQYPNIILALNISPETFKFKINVIIKKELFDSTKKEKVIDEDDRSFEFVGDYISGDYVNMATKYLNYPDLKYFSDIIKEKGNTACY